MEVKRYLENKKKKFFVDILKEAVVTKVLSNHDAE